MSDDPILQEIKVLWEAEITRQSTGMTRAGILIAAFGLCLTGLAKYSDWFPRSGGWVYYLFCSLVALSLLGLMSSIYHLVRALWPRIYSYPPSSKELLAFHAGLKDYYKATKESDTSDEEFLLALRAAYAESTDSLHALNGERVVYFERVVWSIGVTFIFLFAALIPFAYLSLSKTPSNAVKVEVIAMPADHEEPKPNPPPPPPPKPEKPKPPENRLIKEGGLGSNKPPKNPKK